MERVEYERAWNAAIENINMDLEDLDLSGYFAPCHLFNEWYEREVANPPEGWDDHRNE